jgi:hypothetical protein
MRRFTTMSLQWIRAAALVRSALVLAGVALLLAPARPARAAAPAFVPPGLGVSLGTLRVSAATYHHVTLLSVNARTIVIAHSGGMASIRLRDLPPELQSRFGYSAAAESAADEALQRPGEMASEQHSQESHAPAPPTESDSRFEDLLHHFGQKPEIKNEIDLRPRFFQLELGVKEQGHRPSCAVFAVISALEYQNAEVTGQAEKFSEEYLIWATRKTLNRGSQLKERAAAGEPDSPDAADEGFSISNVVRALRAYGIPPQSAMSNTIRGKMADIPEPSPALIEQARTHRRVFVHLVPGHDPVAQIANLIQALNASVPVAVGLRWPNFRTVRAGFLSEQIPVAGSAHAVTLVGYQNSSGQIEDTTFVFKNSFGPTWGEGGYGRVTYRYLRNHLLAAALLEVQRPEESVGLRPPDS